MRRFLVRWRWVLAICSGAVFALSTAAQPGGTTAQAWSVHPAGVEMADRHYTLEYDWENAPYEFGDGTWCDVRQVVSVAAAKAKAAIVSSCPSSCATEMEHAYGSAIAGFAYSEADFYKYARTMPWCNSPFEGEPGELAVYDSQNDGYDYAKLNECYGENRGVSSTAKAADATELVESGVELFVRHPKQLLDASDQEVLRKLGSLAVEPSGAGRSVLNDHLEGLGFGVIDFAARFEEATGIETLSLADNLPGTAAFLGCFRLAERGTLGMDEAVDLLRRSLRRPTSDWIEGVQEITTATRPWRFDGGNLGTYDWPASSTPVLVALMHTAWGQLQSTWSWTANRLSGGGWDVWLAGIPQRLARMPAEPSKNAF